ncbi:5-hydroxytryptamine receptor 4-like [Nematostella vectensis]|uniref:5-hydroxytryptamine receptor 4-like n=1 Tax=Nematostella vectensis TaxID=45351 RepID=UPI002076D99B|nr:5-hydroxytryptamine receptor 4-like [Nematostella vectensis]
MGRTTFATIPTGSSDSHESRKALTWSIIFLAEGLLAIFLNMLTLVAFAVNTNLRKRSLYLLINLSFADMLVGVGTIGISVTMLTTREMYYFEHPNDVFKPAEMTDMAATAASMLGLALMSLERMYAALAPFKHRVLPVRVYIIGIVLPWFGSVSALVLYTASRLYFIYVTLVAVIADLSLVCVCYTVTIISVKRSAHSVAPHGPQQREHELIKTALLVTSLSVISWIPSIIWQVHEGKVDNNWDAYALFGRYVNSFVNPVVYILRMKDFRRAIAKCGRRHHRLVVPKGTCNR